MESTGWSSIRPWIPPLSLSVREITSVSVTFILSASSAPLAGEPDLSALLEDIQHRVEDEPDGDDEESSTNSESEAKKPSTSSPQSVVSRALAGGLSVEVDQGSWRRVFIRIDDKADEAVIIVYGLMPGRQYDVDLELVQGRTLRSQVVTSQEDNSNGNSTVAEVETAIPSSGNADEKAPTRPSTPPNSSSSPSVQAQASSSQTQLSQSPGNGFSFAPLTLEDRVAQLQHTLSLLNSETMTLTASLKSARRDAQKADAAIRSEIEVVKRASDRQNAGELRAKQKVLALQESVKRANISVTEIKAETKTLEESYPELEAEKKLKEKEYARVLAEADKKQAEREREEEVVRKRIEGAQNELNSLGKTQEKLLSKQEKLENGMVKELEQSLEAVERELEELELEENMYAMSRPLMSLGLGPLGPQHPTGMMARPLAESISIARTAKSPSSSPPMQKVHSHNISQPLHLTNFGQLSGAHNQRSASLSTNHAHSLGAHGPHHIGGGGGSGRHNHHGHDRSHTTTTIAPTTILTNPNRRNNNSSSGTSSLPSTPNAVQQTTTDSGSDSSGSSGRGHPGPVKMTPSGSTLSSRATPFEPSRGFGVGMGLLNLRTSTSKPKPH